LRFTGAPRRARETGEFHGTWIGGGGKGPFGGGKKRRNWIGAGVHQGGKEKGYNKVDGRK